MQYRNGLRTKTDQWLTDNETFMDAYYAANRDSAMKAEIAMLEKKYLRKHLIELTGEKDADRILNERGF